MCYTLGRRGKRVTKNNMQIKKSVVLVAVVLVVTAFVYYRYASNLFQKGTPAPMPAKEENATAKGTPEEPLTPMPADWKVLTAETSFDVPNGVDYVKFSVTVDKDGLVQGVGMEGVKSTETNEHMYEWASGATMALKGKKLSEVKPLDRVGSSSLTTTAFNAVLPQLQK